MAKMRWQKCDADDDDDNEEEEEEEKSLFWQWPTYDTHM
jgi:hypothetical protein